MIKSGMKAVLFLFAALLLLTTGCGGKQAPDASMGGQRKLLVYTSFYPMYDFACKVGGEAAEVVNLVSGGVEPHDWEPVPADIVGLEQADVFIYNGAGMEHWVDTVIPALENKALIVVEASAGLSLMEGEDNHNYDHAHGSHDPHVWLSPNNAKRQMEAIRDALAQADPGNAAVYQANCARWSEECEKLDREYHQALDSLENRVIVVAHESFGYLCRDYGLTQKAAASLTPDAEPDPARMAELVEYARDNHVKVIFFEEAGSPKVAQAIAREIGADIGVLNPLEMLNPEEQKAGDDYFSVMRRNLEALTYALTE